MMGRKPVSAAAKTAKRIILKPFEKRKVTIVLTVGTDALLSAFAKMRGTDRSAEVERMILAEMKDLTITLKGLDYGAPPPLESKAG